MNSGQQNFRTAAGDDISEQCIGTMNWSTPVYGEKNIDKSEAVLRSAIDKGINQFDTASCYISDDGKETSEQLLGKYIKKGNFQRDKIFIASKCGITLTDSGWGRIIDNSPQHIVSSCHLSLEAIQTDYLDLFYIHRLESDRSRFEPALEALVKLKDAGKIRHIGLSEVDYATIIEANKILSSISGGSIRLDAVQSEFSILRQTPLSDGVLDACRNAGIRFYAYSPLSRGFLSGRQQIIGETDCRNGIPRYQGHSLNSVIAGIELLKSESLISSGMELNQIALAWIQFVSRSRSQFIHPVIGTSKHNHLMSNIDFTSIDEGLFNRLNNIVSQQLKLADRYPEADMHEFQLSN